jgi:hypothetical protein
MTPRAAALAGLLVGCGVEVGHVRIPLRAPQALDPAQIASVEIAVVHEPATSCVAAVGSNACAAALKSVAQARATAGYTKSVTLTASSGSTATIDGLPKGRACFVAEALSANGTSLASGCSEVTLSVEKHVIEIELQSS